jgi:hypothetical protein
MPSCVAGAVADDLRMDERCTNRPARGAVMWEVNRLGTRDLAQGHRATGRHRAARRAAVRAATVRADRGVRRGYSRSVAVRQVGDGSA